MTLIGFLQNIIIVTQLYQKNVKIKDLPVRRLKQFDIVKAYPKQALKENIEGYVEMELYIDRIGEVYDVKILKSSPNGIFENNSLKTAKSMVFVPEYKNCQAIQSSYNLTVKFVM